jgi:peptidoglycan L-alanyl-D-glutamate endopeptidase CwlK
MLTPRCLARLQGVHADLVRVVQRARLQSDFVVVEGLRTAARQQQLMAAGATRTLNSRHLTGHAVDLAVRVGSEVRWDWPLYEALGAVMKRAAAEEEVAITWGGDWPRFRDGPHFELHWDRYPAPPR